jgi:hypothetical protein
MPTPTAERTLADVAIVIKRQFGDESGVQITDSDITNWVNQAQMEIVNKNPMIQATAVTTAVSGTQTYAVPPDMVQIESVMFNGNILAPTNFEDMRSQLGSDNGTPGTPGWWYVWANLIYLWPIPNTAQAIAVNYSKYPTRVSSPADKLGVPDRYFDRVCEFVMSKAYELDEDWNGYRVNAQKFEDKLQEVNNADKNMIGAFPVATDPYYE